MKEPLSARRIVRASDGLALAVEDAGPRYGTGRAPLLCLAGLTRTQRDFDDLRAFFAHHRDAPRRVVSMDARGRGASQWSPKADDYSVLREADDAAAVACALGLENPVIVGTSRGGILAMVLALSKPGLVAGAVLNDIGPRIAAAGLSRLKAQLGQRRLPADWDDAARLLKTGLGPHFPAFSDADWAQYARLTFAEEDGKPVAAFDEKLLQPLATLPDTKNGIDLSGPFQAVATRPVMILRGEHSDLLDPQILHDAAGLGARTVTVPGEGHAPALRGETLDHVFVFLNDNGL